MPWSTSSSPCDFMGGRQEEKEKEKEGRSGVPGNSRASASPPPLLQGLTLGAEAGPAGQESVAEFPHVGSVSRQHPPPCLRHHFLSRETAGPLYGSV